MDKLRWGIIGTGGIAKRFARALPEAETGALYAVGSRAQKRADAFGDEYNVPARYGSYEDLLADDEVDVIYNALPNHLHLEWTVRAARAGKHILCEKPLTVDAAEAEEMVAAVEEAGVFMMEAFMYRCHPQTVKLIELVRGGAIGEVRMIQCHFGYDLGDSKAAYDNIRLRYDARGGGIMDVGCYTLSMARLIAGAALGWERPAEPERLEGVAYIGKGGVDEWATGVARFQGADGAVILADLACACRVRLDSQVRVWGSEGSITVPVPWIPTEGMVVLSRHGEDRQEIETPARANSYTLEADAVGGALPARQASYPCMTWEDSLGNMRALDMWRASVGLAF
jgi:predicted dehydrogenase